MMTSRKLAGLIAAIIGIVGLLLGLAVIQPSIITEAQDVVMLAVAAIAGLGGFLVLKQALIDEKSPRFEITLPQDRD